MSGAGGGVALGGTRWRLLLPPGWVTLPADDAPRSRRAVERLLERRLAHLPRDRTATARRALTRQLLGQLGDARRVGASEVHALMELPRGLPVTAGLVVVPLPPHESDEAFLDTLTDVLGSSDGVVSSETTTVAGLPAVRRHRRLLAPEPPDVEGRPPEWRTHLDWVVMLPDGDYLVLAFSTQTEPIATELVALFDAIAGSLERVAA